MDAVLIISPHPDDETLGCGGTILRYINEGRKVYWLICTEFYRNGKTPENIELRNLEIERVASLYGFEKKYELHYPAAGLVFDDIGPLIGKIRDIVNEIKPDLIFLPNKNDIHTDHQIVFQAGYACTKNFNFPFIKKVLVYETLSETEFAPPFQVPPFLPQVYIDVTGFFEQKCSIMQVYKSEVMPSFMPRSLQAMAGLAAFRGSAIGTQYAEAFMLLKEIII